MYIKVSWSSVVDAELLWAVVVCGECRNMSDEDLWCVAPLLENSLSNGPFHRESTCQLPSAYAEDFGMMSCLQNSENGRKKVARAHNYIAAVPYFLSRHQVSYCRRSVVNCPMLAVWGWYRYLHQMQYNQKFLTSRSQSNDLSDAVLTFN
jgi:hypothetical protein